MWYFLIGILLLVIGYFTYGKLVEKILGPDDRKTPEEINPDGVDYVELPHWKNMLIQLLNIAGIGPVIGVILGIKFGSIVFLIIPIGNIIGGAVHDFAGGMMSLRLNGANLPVIVQKMLGKHYARAFSFFTCFLLLLVVAVFINIPANLIDLLIPSAKCFWIAVIGIFIYYILATFFSVDKIIGKIYPIFGIILIASSFALLVALLFQLFKDPALMTPNADFVKNMFTMENHHPVIPVLFVTIACGIISGFHATQSPIIARTMKTERQARSSFYGMMIVEGIIAMIWAGGGMAIYNLFPEYMNENPTKVLEYITTHFLSKGLGTLTIIGVIVLAITSGDTAMRSLRLSLAELFAIPQTKLANRILVCIPLIVIVSGLLWWSNLSVESFKHLWNYFSWANQVLAATTLLAATAWLRARKRNYWITLVPALFMVFIVWTYILWISEAHNGPVGIGLDWTVACILGAILAVGSVAWAYWRGNKIAPADTGDEVQSK